MRFGEISETRGTTNPKALVCPLALSQTPCNSFVFSIDTICTELVSPERDHRNEARDSVDEVSDPEYGFIVRRIERERQGRAR